MGFWPEVSWQKAAVYDVFKSILESKEKGFIFGEPKKKQRKGNGEKK